MAKEKILSGNQEKASERASRFLRNINVVGAVALFGAGVVAPAGAVAFNALAGLNAVQAGGFEAIRRHFKKKRLKKNISKK